MKKLGVLLLGLTLSMGTFAQEVKKEKPQKSEINDVAVAQLK